MAVRESLQQCATTFSFAHFNRRPSAGANRVGSGWEGCGRRRVSIDSGGRDCRRCNGVRHGPAATLAICLRPVADATRAGQAARCRCGSGSRPTWHRCPKCLWSGNSKTWWTCCAPACPHMPRPAGPSPAHQPVCAMPWHAGRRGAMHRSAPGGQPLRHDRGCRQCDTSHPPWWLRTGHLGQSQAFRHATGRSNPP
jgi:hypothetical protein